MTIRQTAGPPTSPAQPEAWLRAQVSALAAALLARGVERDQAARLAMAMIDACAARSSVTLQPPA